MAGVVALAVCAPWTIRNCARMKTCSLVSYNGGWNLLIGADDASTGAWAEIKVPPECREVFDEAEKDVCFGGAARRYIAEHPGKWLSLVPKKLAATFDYAGAGGWYLHAASPQAFSDDAKTAVGALETVFERVMLILALLVSARRSWRWVGAPTSYGALRAFFVRRAQRRAAGDGDGAVATAGHGSAEEAGLAGAPSSATAVPILGIVAIGLVFSLMLHAWVAYVALGAALALGLFARDARQNEAILPAIAAAVLLSLAATHAVFFGAGRYSLVAFPFVTAVAALALSTRRR